MVHRKRPPLAKSKLRKEGDTENRGFEIVDETRLAKLLVYKLSPEGQQSRAELSAK